MNKIAFIFPGQGSQHTGMGKDLYDNYDNAKEFFNNIDEISGRSVSKLCFEGSEQDLKQTVNSQPAILTVSMVAYEILKKETNLTPDFVAGHSLGEYSALYAAGVIKAGELIKLVQKRAELMNNAPSGGMTAILGMDDAQISALIQESSSEGIICAANYNTPDQTVISGEMKAIEKANKLAKQFGAKRVISLAVSGAFHSPLMRPISEAFTKYINDTNINDAEIPIVTNVDARSTIDKAELSSKMIKQMYSSVYWKQSISYMVDAGVNTFIEIGPGKVLSGMIKKISKTANVYNVCDKESLENVKQTVASFVSAW
ncbi:MAG TPA: ACP S-malonyltransferase [Candidatus Gastranaerophilales bacterium]|nr:ACP S-malonyltransferase [Candidatus Gastranaerophilales bacterium]